MTRLDVGSELGNYVRRKHQAQMVPTFILFDKRGNEVWRKSGSVPALEAIMSLNL